MPIELVVIVGENNAGKSTLVRSLTGAGSDNNVHNSSPESNISNLVWGQTNLQTFRLQGSINEGQRYARPNSRFNPDQIDGAHRYTVAPWDLTELLNRYAIVGCQKAILSISASVDVQRLAGWNLADYANQVNTSGLGNHRVTHVVSLNNNNQNLITLIGASHFAINGLAPSNQVAAAVRAQIGLM